MVDDPAALLVGHGAAVVAVPDGSVLGGYVDRPGVSNGVLDPVQVSVLTVRAGGRTAALCVADVILVDREMAESCRTAVAGAVGTSPDLVWLMATHTHSGPETGDASSAVRGAVVDAAVVAAGAAARDAVECGLTLHRGDLAQIGGQRSGDGRRTTVPAAALCLRGSTGRVEGLFAAVAVHPTVLPAANLRVSADLPGGMRRALARAGCWAVVATGASGDMSTRYSRREQTPAEVERLGRLAAEQLLALVDGEPIATADPVKGLSGAVGHIRLRARARRTPAQRSGILARAEAAVADASGLDDPARLREAHVALQGARLADEGEGDRIAVPCAAARLDLGGVRLVGLGGEPFSALGDRLVARDGAAMLVGYANGYCGYLPTADAFDREDYEVLISKVARGESERAVDGAAGLGAPQRRSGSV